MTIDDSLNPKMPKDNSRFDGKDDLIEKMTEKKIQDNGQRERGGSFLTRIRMRYL